MVCVLANERRWKQHADPSICSRSIADIIPHRTHESNCFQALLCAVAQNRWYDPSLTDFVQQQGTRFCRWCPEVLFNLLKNDPHAK